MEAYRPRPIRNLGVWTFDDWQLKVHGISVDRQAPPPGLVVAAKRVAAELTGGAASKTGHYGLGFVTIHDGRGSDVVLVDWWADENELHHHVYVAGKGRPHSLRPRKTHELIACVWDLEVVAFERDAWVRHVLAHPESPKWHAYRDARPSL